jgi:orotidine-5'-phosphate decarboxylase
MEIIVDLDHLSLNQITTLPWLISPHVWGFKVDNLLLTHSVSIIDKLKCLGKVFADVKLYDPTKIEALKEADIITMHINSGKSAMKSALQSVKSTKIFGCLPKLKKSECQRIYGKPPEEIVWDLAHLAYETGLHGIVCNEPLEHLDFLKVIEHSKKLRKADFVILGKSITESQDPLLAILEFKTQFSSLLP